MGDRGKGFDCSEKGELGTYLSLKKFYDERFSRSG
jgi:hypothetical protein